MVVSNQAQGCSTQLIWKSDPLSDIPRAMDARMFRVGRQASHFIAIHRTRCYDTLISILLASKITRVTVVGTGHTVATISFDTVFGEQRRQRCSRASAVEKATQERTSAFGAGDGVLLLDCGDDGPIGRGG